MSKDRQEQQHRTRPSFLRVCCGRFGHPLHVADQVGYRIVILDLRSTFTWLDLLEASANLMDLLASFVRIGHSLPRTWQTWTFLAIPIIHAAWQHSFTHHVVPAGRTSVVFIERTQVSIQVVAACASGR